MPEGKQLSFQYGEVSPSLRYRSDAQFRSAALYKLSNGFVRREGGVSNRQGTVRLAEHPLQNNFPDSGDDPKVRLHRFRDPETGEAQVLSFAEAFTGFDRRIDAYDGNLNLLTVASAFTKVNSDGGPAIKCELTQVEDLICLHFGEVDIASDQILLSLQLSSGPSKYEETHFFINMIDPTSPASFPVKGTYTYGLDPRDQPANYLITRVDSKGVERRWTGWNTTGHPHPQLSYNATITDIDSSPDTVRYNIYRSAGSDSDAYGLVGSFAPVDDSTTSYDFNDYVVASDILNGPPISPRLWGEQAAGSYDWFTTRLLRTAARLCSYQQRLLISYDDSVIDKDVIGVSKLGSPKMLHSPSIYKPTAAFEFNIPVRYRKPLSYMLAMERAVLFTEDDVFIVAGATEQGILTPDSPNPVLVSSEGCSNVIAPKNSGNTAYYVNFDHTKLMRLEVAMNGSFKVEEISILSNHFFDEDLIRIEIVKTPEADFVYILRRDGKVVAVQVAMGQAGFSLLNINGYVEDICATESDYFYWPRGKYVSTTEVSFDKRKTEALSLLVIREDNNPATAGDKTRYVELMMPRQDRFEEGFCYSDASIFFGTRLTLGKDGKYFAVNDRGGALGAFTEIDNLNIEEIASGGYAAGTLVNLTATVDLSSTVGAATYVDFYYDDSDGYKRTLRWERTGSPNWSGSSFDVAGFFNDDVPTVLQDVTTAAPSNADALQTRWVIPVRDLVGLRHLIGEEVAIFADGEVIASPNNPSDTYEAPPAITQTGSGGGADGIMTLPDYFGYGVLGLPYEFEMETLPIEPSDNRSLVSEHKVINEAGVAFNRTRGGLMSDDSSADDETKMEPIVFRENEDFDAPSENFSGHIDVNFSGSYSRDSRVKIKQVDPLPMTVLSVYPKGVSGG